MTMFAPERCSALEPGIRQGDASVHRQVTTPPRSHAVPKPAPHRALGIVLLEPDADDATLAERCLQHAGVACNLRCATTIRAFFRMLEDAAPDIILMAVPLAEISATAMITDLRERLPRVPLILCAGAANDAELAALIRGGATDYVWKDRLGRLPIAVEHAAAQATAVAASREAERALRESLAKVEDLYNNAPYGYHSVDANGLVIAMNDTELAWLGFQRDEVVGKLHLTALLAPAGLAAFEANFPVFLSTGPLRDLEIEFRRKDGTSLFALISATPVTDHRGAFVCSRTTLCNVTDQRQAERSLAMHVDILAAEHEVSPDGILVVDEAGDVVSYNRRFADMWDIPAQLLVAEPGQPLLDRPILETVLCRVGDPQGFLAEVERLYHAKDTRVQDEVELRDGRVFERHSGPMRRSDGSYIGRVWFFRDITARKQVERHLREERSKFRSLVEQEVSGIGIIQDDGTFAYVNPYFAQMLGYQPGELLGRRLLDIVPDTEKPTVAEMLHEQLAGRLHSVQIETAAVTRDGGTRDVLVNAMAATYEARPASIAVTLDITERNKAARTTERLNRILRTVNAGNEMLVRAASEAELLDGMCRVVMEVGGYPLAWIGFAEHDAAQTVRPVAGSARTHPLSIQPISWADSAFGGGPTGLAIRTGDVQVLQNASTAANLTPWRDVIDEMGIAAIAAFPLRGPNGVFGAFVVYANRVDAFDQAELSFLRELSQDLVFGIMSQRDRVAVRETARRLQRTMETTVRALATTLELRDPYTAGHQRNVADLAAAIAREMGLPEDDVDGIYFAGMIHDIGKVQIPAEILSKPGKLSPLEYQLLQEHARAGYEIVKAMEFPWPIAPMVLQHHERLDGSGYPHGLRGDEILLGSRILTVADVVEAMTARRPYREALGLDIALREIMQGKDTRYDPQVVDACIRLFREQRFAFG